MLTDNTKRATAHGRVVDHAAPDGVGGLVVEAWDEEHIVADLVARAVTDAAGGFSFTLDERVLPLFSGRRPLLFFRVFRAAVMVADTERTLTWAVGTPTTDLVIVASATMHDRPVLPAPFVVRGTVRGAAGPLAAHSVQAFNRVVRGEVALGKPATTDARGRYSISYSPAALPGGAAELFVRVTSPAGLVVAESPLLCRAPATSIIDIGPPEAGPAEIQSIAAALRPALGDLDPNALTPDEVKLLSCTTQISVERLAAYAASHKLAREAGVRAEVIYALVRGGLPDDRSGLLFKGASAYRRALTAAVANHHVPAPANGSIEPWLAELRQAQIAFHLEPRKDGTGSFGDLLATAGHSADTQRQVVTAYLDAGGNVNADFWAALAKVPELQKPEAVAGLQFTLQVWTVTRSVPLVALLQKTRTDPRSGSARDLVKLRLADWRKLVDQVTVPVGIPGATPDEQKQNYAIALERASEQSFPSPFVVDRVTGDAKLGNAGLKRFFAQATDFAFGATRVSAYLAAKPDSLRGIENPQRVAARLQGMERLYKVLDQSPSRWNDMQALMNDGVHSAHSIVHQGRKRFVASYDGKLGLSASDVFDSARRIASAAHAMAAKYRAEFNSVSAYVLPGPVAGASAGGPPVPDWSALFGSLDYCACAECQSIHGPAAYLVDTLQFLNRYEVPAVPLPWINQQALKKVSQGKAISEALTNLFIDGGSIIAKRTAKDVLFDRRPDIFHLDLSCENTDTPLPYIDLVNEVLEYAVAALVPGSGVALPEHITSGDATPGDLSVNPAPAPPDAVAATVLAGGVFPWTLPYSPPAQETRVYLNHLGVPRHQLMAAFARGVPPEPTDQAVRVAVEQLGLSAKHRTIITGAAPDSTPSLFGLDPAGWLDNLAAASAFMQRTELSFEQVGQLLATQFINGQHDLSIKSNDPSDPATCDLGKLVIAGLTEASAARIVRFLRLRRALGWSIAELDKAIAAFATTLDDDFLVAVAAIDRLRTDLKLPVVELLAWWAPIDTASGGTPQARSLYEKLFLNKAVTNPVDASFALPLGGSETLSAHAPAVLAALGIGSAELALLTDPTVSQAVLNLPVVIAGDQLTLENLSRLYRHVSLARALHLPLRELLSLRAITGGNPFDPKDVPATRRFVDLARQLHASKVKVSELDYLLRHVAQAPSGAAPALDEIDQLLNQVDAGLDKITALTLVAPDPTGDLTGKALATLLGADAAAAALAVILGSSTASATAQSAIVDGSLAAFLDPAVAKAKLIGAGALQGIPARTAYVLPPLEAWLRKTQGEQLVMQAIGDALQLESATVGLLLSKAIALVGDPTKPALAGFQPRTDAEWAAYVALDDAGRAAQDKARRLGQRPTAVLVQKAAMVVRKLRITSAELAWIAGGDPAGAWLDFNKLPVAQVASAQALFPAWKRVADAFALRDTLPGGPTALLELLQIAATGKNADGAPVDFLSELADRSGWTLADLQQLAGTGGWFAAAFAPLTVDARLLRLRECLLLVKRLGVSVAQAEPWCADDPDAQSALAAAHAAKSAAKAKYDEATWTTTARPLVDVLRERLRDALVGYLVWQRGYDGPDRLFEELLVDVEMSPCFLTSRIKLAMGSVQTFIRRGFLHLEPEVAFDEEAADEWKWRHSFRMWEANRKVFLFPENWIDPALRHDDTEIFRKLESELQQSDLKQDTAEAAFENYLEALDEVSRLQVAGMCLESNVGKDHVDVLHVFGRTQQGSPPAYYHRMRVDSSTWTAWEKLPLDIEGDHFIPVVWDHRLIVFWPKIKSKADENQSANMGGNPKTGGNAPTTHLEIGLAWSERRSGKWSAKKTTGDLAIWFNAYDGIKKAWVTPDSQFLHFNAWVDGDSLFVECRLNWAAWANLLYARDLRLNTFQFVGGDGGIYLNNNGVGAVSWDHHQRTPAGEEYPVPGFVDSNQQVDSIAPTFAPRYDPVLGNAEVPSQLQILPGVPDFPSNPFFYADSRRTFFVDIIEPEFIFDVGKPGNDKPGAKSPIPINYYGNEPTTSPPQQQPSSGPTEKYRFSMFFHPYVSQFISQLRRFGIDGLLRWSMSHPPLQLQSGKFFEGYKPVKAMFGGPYPINDVDFSQRGAYSIYNWELFFHAPLLIAERLSQNQQFAEAQRWFHFIFDPTTGSSDTVPRRFWKVRPFYENTDLRSIEQMLLGLSQQPQTSSFWAIQQLATGQSGDAGESSDDLSAQIAAWEKDPFNPHLIARMRPIAYQKHVVMKYIDNLIAWGDQLFAQDTIETINEATQLYILAAEILGPRPHEVRRAASVSPKTYLELEPLLDDFSNALVEIESWAPMSKIVGPPAYMGQQGPYAQAEPPVIPSMLYFCVPQNDRMLAYWDTVADRLFKIRNCMNLQGVVQQLPLFEPPLDPGLLVRGAAAGVDLSSLLSDTFAPSPRYRFATMAQKANELIAEVRALGGALLSALEKRDGETLSLLRQTHELALLAAVRRVRQRALDDATANSAALEAAQAVAQARLDYYSGLDRISQAEQSQMVGLGVAQMLHRAAQEISLGVATLHAIPDFVTGVSGITASPVATLKLGGTNFGNALAAAVEALNMHAGAFSHEAQMAGINAGYQRRWAEWQHQADLAKLDIAQIQKQLDAAQIKIDIAQSELDNQDLQLSQSQEVSDYLRSKFSNAELYNWMVAQTAAVYFQSYKLAYQAAKKAERSFQFEIGDTSTSFIQFGYWDSLKKGLLAGERLSLDLKRMEVAFLDDNQRGFELNRQVSLVLHDPMALIALKENGRCEIELPEALFDMDYPGHYLRRLKSVSLTIPCVVGPYTSVNCTLTLLSSKVRTAGEAADYANPTDAEVTSNFGAIQSIATSTGQSDSGMFELSFRDERYLPFEGSGAWSRWRIELPKDTNAFDTDTISDVILRLSYTARDGGAGLASQARAAAVMPPPVAQTVPPAMGAFPAQQGLPRLFSLRHEFPSEWSRFVSPPPGGAQSLLFQLAQDRFPFRFRGKTIAVAAASIFFQLRKPLPNGFKFDVKRDGGAVAFAAQATAVHPVLAVPYTSLKPWPSNGLGGWRIEPSVAVQSDTLEDIWVVLDYSAT